MIFLWDGETVGVSDHVKVLGRELSGRSTYNAEYSGRTKENIKHMYFFLLTNSYENDIT
jgi:hypothetical protein